MERRYYLFAGMSVSEEEAYTQLVKKVDFSPLLSSLLTLFPNMCS